MCASLQPESPTHHVRASSAILLQVSNHDMPHNHIVDLFTFGEIRRIHRRDYQMSQDYGLAMAFNRILSALKDDVPDHTGCGQ